MSNGNGNGLGEKLVNASRIGLPLPLVIVIVGGFLSGAWWFNDHLARLEKLISTNTAGIVRNTVSPEHAWRRWDMSLWCARAEKQNPSFKCPSPYGQPPARRRGGEN